MNTSVRALAAIAVATMSAAACSSSDDAIGTTTAAPLVDTADAEADTTGTTGNTETSVPATTEPPPTTVPTTTVPPTTVPPTTAPPTTAPPTTVPPPAVDLTQFCFRSEQVYLATELASVITEPTPDEAEVAMTFLVSSTEQSVATAPDGFGEEATRFLEIVLEIDELFERYDYDVESLDANEDVETYAPLFDEYDAIVADDLVPFLDEACATPLDVLDDQAVKLAPVIGDAGTWPLVAFTNTAGDIRLLAPPEWGETTGSTAIEEVTFLQVTPDAAEFEATWNVPGVFVTVFYVEGGVADPSTRFAGTAAAQGCGAPVSVEPYTDPVYTGELRLHENCGGVDTTAAVAAVTNADGDVEVVLEFQFPGGLDRDLLDQMLAGFAAGA